MKKSSEKFPLRGFTLVELLVVIAIIAVLAAAGFAGGSAAMNKARKVSAQSVATSIATSVEQFYTEYSALPDMGDGATYPLSTDTSEAGVDLLNILAGQEPPASSQNARKIRFFSAKQAKGDRNGANYVGTGNEFSGLFDPWGKPYYIELDDDYDGLLTFTPGQGVAGVASLPEVKLRGSKVAVYSLGVADPADAATNKLAKSW